MIDGIQDRKKVKLYYTNYDDNFHQKEMVETRFKRCIDEIVSIFGEKLIESEFRKTTLFYSIFCVVYDLLYGLPKHKGSTFKFKKEMYVQIRSALFKLEEELRADEPSPKYAKFKDASSRHTTDQSRRLIRHRAIKKEILTSLEMA